VGGEHDLVVGGERGDHAGERAEHLDVRVQVDRHVVVGQEGAQQPRLHRRAQLGHRVGERHPAELGGCQRDVVRAEEPDAWHVLRDAGELVGVGVDDQHREPGVRVVPAERLGEHAGRRQVVTRDDRAGADAGTWLSHPRGAARAGR
jgi:hypothetical protein